LGALFEPFEFEFESMDEFTGLVFRLSGFMEVNELGVTMAGASKEEPNA
jgi:hypothetical protein